ncbi:MAG: acetyl-CoA carboxylase biotin carboxyl carrier protein subunit [Xanthobacteraceae bacterium]
MSNSPVFTNSDVEEILRVVDRLTDVEVKFETAEFKLHVRKGVTGAASSSEPAVSLQQRTSNAPIPALEKPSLPEVRTPAAPSSASPKAEAGTVAIKAPMLGRFYRAPSPSEPAYVEVGKRVGPDDTVCMIEVMKLFKTVNAGVAGTIVSIAVNDGDMVEDDQPLFFVKPD